MTQAEQFEHFFNNAETEQQFKAATAGKHFGGVIDASSGFVFKTEHATEIPCTLLNYCIPQEQEITIPIQERLCMIYCANGSFEQRFPTGNTSFRPGYLTIFTSKECTLKLNSGAGKVLLFQIDQPHLTKYAIQHQFAFTINQLVLHDVEYLTLAPYRVYLEIQDKLTIFCEQLRYPMVAQDISADKLIDDLMNFISDAEFYRKLNFPAHSIVEKTDWQFEFEHAMHTANTDNTYFLTSTTINKCRTPWYEELTRKWLKKQIETFQYWLNDHQRATGILKRRFKFRVFKKPSIEPNSLIAIVKDDPYILLQSHIWHWDVAQLLLLAASSTFNPDGNPGADRNKFLTLMHHIIDRGMNAPDKQYENEAQNYLNDPEKWGVPTDLHFVIKLLQHYPDFIQDFIFNIKWTTDDKMKITPGDIFELCAMPIAVFFLKKKSDRIAGLMGDLFKKDIPYSLQLRFASAHSKEIIDARVFDACRYLLVYTHNLCYDPINAIEKLMREFRVKFSVTDVAEFHSRDLETKTLNGTYRITRRT